jgi:hypothetical protein
VPGVEWERFAGMMRSIADREKAGAAIAAELEKWRSGLLPE